MTEIQRTLILRHLLRLLTSEVALPLAEMREELECVALVEPSGNAKMQAAVERTLRNHLKHLREGCLRVLGDRCAWIQGIGADVDVLGGGKGPYYRLRLHDAVPLIDANGEVIDSAEGDALLAAGGILSVPGGGPFAGALERLRTRLAPDGLPIHGVWASALDTGTRQDVLQEALRVLHRNAGQSHGRSRCQRWLRLWMTEGEQLVWPMVIHPAWTPPCPGWRLLAWDGAWKDIPLISVNRAVAGPMASERGVHVPDELSSEAALLQASAFMGSCPGPRHHVEISLGSNSGWLDRMHWGADEKTSTSPTGTVITCTTSDLGAMQSWIGTMAGVRLVCSRSLV